MILSSNCITRQISFLHFCQAPPTYKLSYLPHNRSSCPGLLFQQLLNPESHVNDAMVKAPTGLSLPHLRAASGRDSKQTCLASSRRCRAGCSLSWIILSASLRGYGSKKHLNNLCRSSLEVFPRGHVSTRGCCAFLLRMSWDLDSQY